MPTQTTTRIALSITLLVLALMSVSGILDAKGDQYTQEGFKRALITFAVARGLNGVISVAQETEVSLQPAGVGVTILPGQILDPINDLIERFSWIMLASSTSLGLQKLFSSIVSWPVFTYLLLIWVTFIVALIWWPSANQSVNETAKSTSNRTAKDKKPAWQKSLMKATVVFLILRFLVPVIALSSEAVYSVFLEQRYEESLQGLKAAQEEVSNAQSVAQAPGESEEATSIFTKAKRLYDTAKESVNIGERMSALGEIASKATEHAVELTVIFIFQTMIFPLLFLWLLVKISRKFLSF